MPCYEIDGLRPVVHPTAYVHPTAVLIGDVVVGPGAYIGPCASLRGDFGRIVLQQGCNVQDTCVIHGFPASEIERYIAWPGQACSYFVGYRRLLELRERARERLGPAFDRKRFHDRILQGGTMPLAVLDGSVEEWIAAQLRGGEASAPPP